VWGSSSLELGWLQLAWFGSGGGGFLCGVMSSIILRGAEILAGGAFPSTAVWPDRVLAAFHVPCRWQLQNAWQRCGCSLQGSLEPHLSSWLLCARTTGAYCRQQHSHLRFNALQLLMLLLSAAGELLSIEPCLCSACMMVHLPGWPPNPAAVCPMHCCVRHPAYVQR
jgi:hypothetical protein